MGDMFFESEFNGNISKWSVSSVAFMVGMFYESQFNGDISKWDVSNVTNMNAMYGNSQFKGDLSSWNVSNVTNMNEMFFGCEFNNDISNWNVSKVVDMGSMFEHSRFSGDLSRWENKPSNYSEIAKRYKAASQKNEKKESPSKHLDNNIKQTFNYKDDLNEYELNRIKSDYSIEEIMVFEKNVKKLAADLNAGVVMYEWEYIDNHFSKGFCPLSYLFLEANNMILSNYNDENLGFLELKNVPDWIVLRFLTKLSKASDDERNKIFLSSIDIFIENAKYTDESIAANIGSVLMLASDLWSDDTSWDEAWDVVKNFSDLCVLEDEAQASIEQWIETYQ
jgi:surface protein